MSNCQKKCELNSMVGLASYLLTEKIQNEKDCSKKIELEKQLTQLNEEYKKQWEKLDKEEVKNEN